MYIWFLVLGLYEVFNKTLFVNRRKTVNCSLINIYICICTTGKYQVWEKRTL